MISGLIYESKSVKLNTSISSMPVLDKITWDDDGNIILPLRLASLTILNFGTVRSEEGFYSDKNFFPIGWESIREYKSTLNPDEWAFYKCSISEWDGKPWFRVTCE